MQIYTSFTPNNPYENNYNKNKNELSQEEKLQVAKLQK